MAYRVNNKCNVGEHELVDSGRVLPCRRDCHPDEDYSRSNAIATSYNGRPGENMKSARRIIQSSRSQKLFTHSNQPKLRYEIDCDSERYASMINEL